MRGGGIFFGRKKTHDNRKPVVKLDYINERSYSGLNGLCTSSGQ